MPTCNGWPRYEISPMTESFTSHSNESSLVKTLKHAATTLNAISENTAGSGGWMTHLELQLFVRIPFNLLPYYLTQIRANPLSSAGPLPKGPLTVFSQELVHLGECPFPSIMTHRDEGIFEHIGRIRRTHHADCSQVSEFEVFGEEL